MLPSPICTPISTPITCAMTAPGPRNGDRNGNEHIHARITRPTILPASGDSKFAITSPMPVPRITPISIDTNAINGRIVRIMVLIESRPA